MKRSWVWVLAAIAVVCLLGSLTVKASLNPASRFEKHWVARPRESHSPSSCQACESYAEAGFTVMRVRRNSLHP